MTDCTDDCLKSWELIMDEMCHAVDVMAEAVLTPGTPIHTFQQEMIGHVKKYREAKENEVTTCSDSGISFNKKGEVV